MNAPHKAQQGYGHIEELQPDGCEGAGGEAGLSGVVVKLPQTW